MAMISNKEAAAAKARINKAALNKAAPNENNSYFK